MESFETDHLLQMVRLKEKEKSIFKGLFTASQIVSTRQLAFPGKKRVPGDLSEKTFRPSQLRLLLLIPLGFLCFLGYQFLKLAHKDPFVYVICIMLVVGICITLYHVFFNPERNFIIHVDRQAITIRDEVYPWNSIQETAILQLGSGRNEKSYLVLLFNDGAYEKFGIAGFMGFRDFKAELSAYVEYFKKSSVR